MKKRRSTVPVWTLKRASRRAPQITNRKAPNHAGRLRSFSAKEYMRNAGATQKETTSASESNSTPNWLVAFISRATRPSSRSMTIATKIASAASQNRPPTVSGGAKKPQKRLPVVRRHGSRTSPRPRAARIGDGDDEAGDGRAVDVHVERRQEGGDAHGRADERVVELIDGHHLAVGRRQHRAGNGRRLPLRVAEEAEGGQRRRHEGYREGAPAGQREPGGDRRRNRDEGPALARDGKLRHHPIRGGAIHAIIERRRLPPSSIGCSASRRRIARNPARLAWFSSTHSRANWPDWISPRIFFISAFVASLTTRGPRV